MSRRRLERDLHDGAQSRFVALALDLRLTRARANEDSDVADVLDRAIENLAGGLEVLRELARGIHPAILTDKGLEPALRPRRVTRAPDSAARCGCPYVSGGGPNRETLGSAIEPTGA